MSKFKKFIVSFIFVGFLTVPFTGLAEVRVDQVGLANLISRLQLLLEQARLLQAQLTALQNRQLPPIPTVEPNRPLSRSVTRPTNFNLPPPETEADPPAPAIVNRPPDFPTAPIGETTVAPGSMHAYSSVITDPDGDMLKHVFEYHNTATYGGNSFWVFDLLPSGSTVSRQITWPATPGTYTLKVFAIDESGLQGPRSPALTVTVQ